MNKLKPNEETMSLVNIDLEVDIEALNENQAKEILNQRLRKTQKSLTTPDDDSSDGLIEAKKIESGQVRLGNYVNYNFNLRDLKSS